MQRAERLLNYDYDSLFSYDQKTFSPYYYYDPSFFEKTSPPPPQSHHWDPADKRGTSVLLLPVYYCGYCHYFGQIY